MYKISLWIMALLYIAAGINHFVHPATYIAIMPHFLPASSFQPLVAVSGVCEIAFGALLMLPGTRKIAAWLIISLLTAVFPANIQMTINFVQDHNPDTWLTWLRLSLQPLLIWWSYAYTR